MMNSKRLLLILVMLMFGSISLTVSAATKLYKWVDEQGRVHYSDSPQGNAQQTAIESTTSKVTIIPQVTNSDPLPLPTDLNVVITVVSTAPLLSQSLIESGTLGEYRFGADCVSPTAMNVSQVTQGAKHQRLLPNIERFSAVAAATIAQRGGLANSQTFSHFRQNPIAKPEHTLMMEVAELKLVACKTDLKRDRSRGLAVNVDPNHYQWNRFNKLQAYLKINWWVRDSNGDVLYQGQTQSATPTWQTKIQMNRLILKLVEQATLNLLGDAKLMTWLSQQDSAANSGGWFNFSSAPEPRPAASSRVAGMMTKAKTAQVLAYLAQHKARLVEYYMMQGDWPDNDAAKHWFGENNYRANGIEQLRLLADGSLRAELSFARGHYIQLTPVIQQSYVRWECASSLPSDSLPSIDCQQR
ncbi:MAG: DUF4124 domain-containing protein [Gammaproteobacteria bacterium]|nr:DUF4124 domain-containing protein [Gammaproteobacteria bacterium]